MFQKPTVISLFTGAGGLDLGLEAAGFSSRICVEIDLDARATLQHNRPDWKLAEPGDIHALTAKQILAQSGLRPEEADLLAGGPPCQPFSKSGYWVNGDSKRLDDPRAQTLIAYLDVVRHTRPKVVLLENVKGLTFDKKNEGLRLLKDGLEQINAEFGTCYNPTIFELNAADFGVPQLRERVFLVASREGLPFTPPAPTHGREQGLFRYRTAWDAIGDLEDAESSTDLRVTGKWAGLLPSVPEGSNYLWHTTQGNGEPLFGWRTRFWSFLLKLAKDKPSWTIQAQPGPATGPFHWKNRMLSVRELCRLQTFPDDYEIVGDRRSAQRLLGNAVPSAIGELLGLEIRRQLFGDQSVSRDLSLIPEYALEHPPMEKVLCVPESYLSLRGEHKPHPGTGRGPSAERRTNAVQA